MKYRVLFSFPLLVGIAHAKQAGRLPPSVLKQIATQIPENCKAPAATFMLPRAIEESAGIDSNGAHVVIAKVLHNEYALERPDGKYQLQCPVEVTWSDGTKQFRVVSLWDTRSGKLMVASSPRLLFLPND